jgi:hypothetical protein
MSNGSARVLKKGQVQIQGVYKVQVSPAGATGGAAGLLREVRLVQKHSDYALIEVVCSCGARALVRCEYAAEAGPQAGSPPQK